MRRKHEQARLHMAWHRLTRISRNNSNGDFNK